MIKDIIQQNENTTPNSQQLAVLKEHFPACFKTDGSFDLERFKAEIAATTNVVQEGYELKFLGKSYAKLLASTDTTTVIQPNEAHNSLPENADSANIYISGDNLDGLKHLLKSYNGAIKCIYIDPPYNTGSDGFVYFDNFNYTKESLQEKLSVSEEEAERILELTKRGSASHSAWLMFMYSRLLLARDLLSDDGVIFISIDDNEQANLKLLCDDVFGEENLITPLYLQVRFAGKTLVEDAEIQKVVEIVYVYKRQTGTRLIKESVDYDIEKFKYKIIEKGEPTTIVLGDKQVDIFTKGNYEIVDDGSSLNNLKEIWATGKILDGNSSGRFFRDHLIGREKFDGLGTLYKVSGIGDDQYSYRYFTGPQKASATKGKYFQGVPKEVLVNFESKEKNIPIPNFENYAEDFGNIRHEGNIDFRNGKKPTILLEKLINYVVEKDSEATIVDFFSGSASTAHAVLQLNAKDSGNRKFIAVQLPEVLSPDNPAQRPYFDFLQELNLPTTLDYIGIERLKRAVAKIKEDYPDKLLDLGFKHFILSEPNQNTLDKLYSFDKAGLLADTSILDDFGKPTILATWLNADGYGLTINAETIDLAGYTAYYCQKHLYLIDGGFTLESMKALLRKYDAEGHFNPENLVLFGYSFPDWSINDMLEQNLRILNDGEKNLKINFTVRY
ncbi:MAG: site-specific DNA-methyltransferase [Bacteroidota bacterium]